jgi:hypothetical protein
VPHDVGKRFRGDAKGGDFDGRRQAMHRVAGDRDVDGERGCGPRQLLRLQLKGSHEPELVERRRPEPIDDPPDVGDRLLGLTHERS